MGDKIASLTLLESLTAAVSKDQHLPRESDLNVHDKMNYGAVSRLCKPHIIQLLQQYIPGTRQVMTFLLSSKL